MYRNSNVKRNFLRISSLFHLRYTSDTSGVCKASQFINNIVVLFGGDLQGMLQQLKHSANLIKAYPLEQVVKSKFQDIQQAISHVPAEHENVYSNILMLSTRNSNNSDEIEDENI